jgi:hypothetical protein
MPANGLAETAVIEGTETVVHTGSISSRVDLDLDKGEAHKVYCPSRLVRFMYWFTFQAPFPYVANHDALEAARQRRTIVDLLTKYWFGHHLVARVLEIDDTSEGAHDFVTELVKGNEPPHQKRTLDFMRRLDKKFLEAGLPTWQVSPYNPHAITNFILTPEGTFRIIDLESSLVAFLYPISGLLRLMRRGLFPSFDDIDVQQLRHYVQTHGLDLENVLGREYTDLVAAVSAYQSAADRWHGSESRVFNRAFKFLAERLPTAWTK